MSEQLERQLANKDFVNKKVAEQKANAVTNAPVNNWILAQTQIKQERASQLMKFFDDNAKAHKK